MILVDSAVWIDHFRGVPTWQAAKLAEILLVPSSVLLADLVLLELLQGVSSGRQARLMEQALLAIPRVEILDITIARLAAAYDRTLRGHGVTIRRTTDLIIGTWCIAHDCELLHRDRDFVPMQRHLGLRARTAPAH